MHNFEYIYSALGLCWIIYLISRIFNFYLLKREDQNKPTPNFLYIVVAFLNLLSLPVFICSSFVDSKFTGRLCDIHDRDMRLAEEKYTGKCTHCYSKAVSHIRPFGYNKERQTWTDTSTYSIYIPPADAWPDLSPDIEDFFDLHSDLFDAFMARRPFSEHHIGQTNRYTGDIIECEEDYEQFIHELATAYAKAYQDPFAF